MLWLTGSWGNNTSSARKSRHVQNQITKVFSIKSPYASFNMILTNFKIYDLSVNDLKSMALRLYISDYISMM